MPPHPPPPFTTLLAGQANTMFMDIAVTEFHSYIHTATALSQLSTEGLHWKCTEQMAYKIPRKSEYSQAGLNAVFWHIWM